MNQNDRDYLCGLMMERLSYHVGQHKAEFFPNSEQFYALEQKYTNTLEVLLEDKADTIREYIQTITDRAGAREQFCFRFGLRDGIVLGQLLRELM